MQVFRKSAVVSWELLKRGGRISVCTNTVQVQHKELSRQRKGRLAWRTRVYYRPDVEEGFYKGAHLTGKDHKLVIGGNRNTPSVLISQGSCNKFPQTGWLLTIEMYSLTARETRHLELRCWQGWALRRLRGGSVPGLSPGLWQVLAGLVLLGLQPHPSIPRSTFSWPSPPCLCVLNSPLLSLKKTPVVD